MTKEELIRKLKLLHSSENPADAHQKAENLLLEYVHDLDVMEAFALVPKFNGDEL